MTTLKRNLIVAIRLITRSTWYYIFMGILTLLVFFLMSLTANTIYYNHLVERGTELMNLEYMDSLYTSAAMYGNKLFSKIYPQYSYAFFDTTINNSQCIIYDIRIAESIKPLLGDGEWPTELSGQLRPVVVSADLEDRYPLGKVFHDNISVSETKTGIVYEGNFIVVGVLEENAVVFRYKYTNGIYTQILYREKFDYLQPNFSGFITFCTIDEIKPEQVHDCSFIYDLDVSYVNNEGKWEQPKVISHSEPIVNILLHDNFRVLLPFTLALSVLWLSSLCSIAGLMSVKEGMYLLVLKKVGLGRASTKQALFLRSSYTIIPATIGIFIACPSFGGAEAVTLLCYSVWLIYTILMTIVSWLTFTAMEVEA